MHADHIPNTPSSTFKKCYLHDIKTKIITKFRNENTNEKKLKTKENLHKLLLQYLIKITLKIVLNKIKL